MLNVCRRGPRGERAHLPRERRQPGGRDARVQRGRRVALHLPQGRCHRHRQLPPQRTQRGGRAHVHAAAHVPEDPQHQARYLSI